MRLEQGHRHSRALQYLLVDVARASVLALLPAQELSHLQKPIPGTACLWPRHPWVQLLEAGAIPKVFRS